MITLFVNRLTRQTKVTKCMTWLGDKNQYMSEKYFWLLFPGMSPGGHILLGAHKVGTFL